MIHVLVPCSKKHAVAFTPSEMRANKAPGLRKNECTEQAEMLITAPLRSVSVQHFHPI